MNRAVDWAESLWDLLTGGKPAEQAQRHPASKPASRAGPRKRAPKPGSGRKAPATAARQETMEARYERITRDMLSKYGVKVRRWRTSMSGVAWEVHYRDGTRVKLIEAPKPRGPMSAAVFLHEVGHHAIGLGVHRPRCLEEYHAWAFAVSAMEELGLNVTDSVRRRVHQSLHYAVAKARRRGIKELPGELAAYTRPWRPAAKP